MKSFLCKWADMLSILLEVSYKALDSAEFEGLLCGVAFKLKAALQVSVSEVVHEGADDGGHQVLFCDQHPAWKISHTPLPHLTDHWRFGW